MTAQTVTRPPSVARNRRVLGRSHQKNHQAEELRAPHDAIVADVKKIIGGRLFGLDVAITDREIEVCGAVPTYYLRQTAEQELRQHIRTKFGRRFVSKIYVERGMATDSGSVFAQLSTAHEDQQSRE